VFLRLVVKQLKPPFPQQFPRLHQLLNGTRWRKRPAVDDRALPVGTLVEIENGVFAEEREVAHQLFEIVPAQDLFAVAGFRSPRHDNWHSIIFAFYSLLLHTKNGPQSEIVGRVSSVLVSTPRTTSLRLLPSRARARRRAGEPLYREVRAGSKAWRDELWRSAPVRPCRSLSSFPGKCARRLAQS